MAMVKLIRTLAPENGMDLGNVLSFETENYIGLWNYNNDSFVLIRKSEIEFHPVNLPRFIETFGELDDVVYEECDEHIIGVSDRSDYRITLHPEN